MEKIFKKQIYIPVFILIIFATAFISFGLHARATGKMSAKDREKLEKRVNELMKMDAVEMRSGVDDVFLLADIYAEEGNNQKAAALNQVALKADSWRLEYQLKYARLLLKNGDKKQAISKAELVMQLSEDEDLYDNALSFLNNLQAAPPEGYEMKGKTRTFNDVEILIVPLGKIDRRLVSKAKEKLEEIIGANYQMVVPEINIGNFDRSYADHFLKIEIENIKKNITENEWKTILIDQKISEKNLETNPGRIKFLKAFFRKKGAPEEKIKEFDEFIHQTMNSGQYNVDRLLNMLESKYPLDPKSTIKGVLGVTAADIFNCDNNFLFGYAHRGYGVISYRRFTASFNNTPPNRPKLIERIIKQAISSTFFIFGIPRCTSPTCIRAYPNNLEEHDRKGVELCSWCREQLANYFKANRKQVKQ